MHTINEEKIIDDTFKVIKTLGKGFTAKVVQAEHKDSGYNLAIKIFKPMRQMNLVLDNFRKEVNAMKNLKHDNLVNIIAANENGVYKRPGKESSNIMYLGIELAENAELFDFIADPGKGFSENTCRFYFTQLISGLKSMHDLKLAHRDLKTENLFLDDKFNLKIGDFGFAKFMDPNNNDGKLKTQLGTSGYQCPELIEGQSYDGQANDIFACGVILFILVNAYPPFREARRTDNWYRHLYYEKFDNFWNLHSKRGQSISNEMKELITGMLRYKNRFTLDDVLKSTWLNDTSKLPSKEDFMSDMTSRKELVDNRKSREAEESLMLENQNSGGKVYRGEDDEGVVDAYLKTLEDYGVDNFTTKKWGGFTKSKNLIRFKGTDIKKVYKALIAALVEEKGELELHEDGYSFSANVALEHEDEENKDNETFSENVNFDVNMYVDYEKESVVVDFIKDSNTNIFSFKELFARLQNKYVD